MEKTSNPANRNFSNGMSGVLGGGSPYIVNNANLPDLMANKRESKLHLRNLSVFSVSQGIDGGDDSTNKETILIGTNEDKYLLLTKITRL